MFANATFPASCGAARTPRVALVGRPMMKPPNMFTVSVMSRRSSGSPPDKNTRRTPARLARMASSCSSVGSAICSVSEQNTQPKSHRFVTCTITDNGTVAARASTLRSASPDRSK